MHFQCKPLFLGKCTVSESSDCIAPMEFFFTSGNPGKHSYLSQDLTWRNVTVHSSEIAFLEVKEKYINCFMRIPIHLDRMIPMIPGL